MPSLGRQENGFSLIELLVVILIIGILSTIAIPSLLRQRDKAKNTVSISLMRDAVIGLRTYALEYRDYAALAGAATDAGLSLTEPDGGANGSFEPGDRAIPSNFWVGAVNETTGEILDTVPGMAGTSKGSIVVCSVSQGDSVFCLYDNLTGPVAPERSGRTLFARFQTANGEVASIADLADHPLTDSAVWQRAYVPTVT